MAQRSELSTEAQRLHTRLCELWRAQGGAATSRNFLSEIPLWREALQELVEKGYASTGRDDMFGAIIFPGRTA